MEKLHGVSVNGKKVEVYENGELIRTIKFETVQAARDFATIHHDDNPKLYR